MCGFIGFSGYYPNSKNIIGAMMDRIIHRGPDMSGEYIGDGITLGFRRLSIIDLIDGTQPMFNETGSHVIVCNGEICNFMELREQLIARGHIFKSRCDMEVILHGYEEYGEAIVLMLRGMFSFAIWNRDEKTLFCARDPFGIKPFYYTDLGGEILFGSEIKCFLEHPAFKPRVNNKALRPYLSFQYSSMDETFFTGVYKLPPAHILTFKNGKIKTKRYWEIVFEPDDKKSLADFINETDEIVRASVNAHKISDVPVGSFLSGGIDSSYVTASLLPEHTFSVGFDIDGFDETQDAIRLSKLLGVQHHTKIITPEECFDAFPDIQYHMDEPQANPSSVPLWFLSELTRRYVTVVLSGEGADEIWGGYESYFTPPLMRKYKHLPGFLRRGAASIAEKLPYFKGHDFIINSSGVPEKYFIGQAIVFPEKAALHILTPDYLVGPSPRDITRPIYDKVKDATELTKKQYLDLNLWLPSDILLKADKMSMAHSVELRVPYLDRVVMESARRVPDCYRVNEIDTKFVLRRAAAKVLPAEWATRPKKGFPVPIRKWLREDKFYSIVREYFTADYAAEFFNRDKILKILDDHKNGVANNQRMIWVIYAFLVWYKRFFIDFDKKT